MFKGSGDNTVRLSATNQTALCSSGLPRLNVAQRNQWLGASGVAASRSYKKDDSLTKRTVLDQVRDFENTERLGSRDGL